MLDLAAYADKLSVRPGESIRFHVSNATGAPVAASVVRVVSADPNPAGPGIILEPVHDVAVIRHAEPRSERVDRGSYARVDVGARLGALADFSLLAAVMPTRLGHGEQPVIGWVDDRAATGITFALTAQGQLCAVTGHATAGLVRTIVDLAIPAHRWSRIACTYDAAHQKLTFICSGATASVSLAKPIARPRGGQLVIAAAPHASFDGRIETPMLFDRVLSADDIAEAFAGNLGRGVVAAWDFAREINSDRIIDVGPNALHGSLVNAPARAMRGSRWTGREQCFRHAASEYGAIHFHSDDLEDCRWPATHEVRIPEDLRSAAYAVLLEADGQKENVPFFVVPPKGTSRARIAVLISTFTYTVYHNHARPEWQRDPEWTAAWTRQMQAWPGAYPNNPGAHPEYGLSTYNLHGDGSGIHLASWQRPMLNVRIGYVTYPGPEIRGSGLRHFPADTHLTAWLEHLGYDYDLITDWELHHEGTALLKPYTVVLTGTHPEYHTAEMLDALEAYRDGGGRLMYLGGNGFYWKIALNQNRPGQIEIRRAEGGIRAWAAETGEYYNQLDGEYGGLWRRNGRPPQRLVGVGFTAQGNFVGSYYRIAPQARTNPAVAWMFEGIDGDIVGNFGLSGHGAAGFELDRADVRLGTPDNAIVVASSEAHPPEAPWVLVPEEHLTHIVTLPGEPVAKLIRADMTIFPTPGDGAVFATGSITYCGSLPCNAFTNSISRLTRNVLDRFLTPGPVLTGR
jgi:N,N-dimethylformamidase